MVQEIKDKEDFEKVLSEHKVVVVDFTATWCGPCKMVAPKFEEMSKKYPDAVFVKVDVDQCQDISQNAGIRAMPTFHIYKEKQRVTEIIGVNVTKLEADLQTALA